MAVDTLLFFWYRNPVFNIIIIIIIIIIINYIRTVKHKNVFFALLAT